MGNSRQLFAKLTAMEPTAFKSQVRSILINLKSRGIGANNLGDLVLSQESKQKEKFLLRTADTNTAKSTDLIFPRACAKLRFEVLFAKDKSAWSIVRYSFTFDRNGNWFRYDLDPDKAKDHEHPLAHLHVGRDEPRYPTATITNPLILFKFLEQQGLLDPGPPAT